MRGIPLPFTIAIGLAIVASAGAVAGIGREEGAAPAAGRPEAAPSQRLTAQVAAALERQPVAFVANRGQTDPRVRFAAQGSGFAFFATPDDVRIALDRTPTEQVALALRFIGHDPAARIVGSGRVAGDVNYLSASAGTTLTGVPRYGAVVYRGLWPGVDLALREQDGAMKYEFRVQPGASPSAIRLAYAGAEGLAVAGDGSLAIRTAIGTLHDAAPVAYQDVDGVRVPVTSSYDLATAGRFGFRLGAYRADRALVIDPGIQFTTFLGGSSNEVGTGIASDAAGNIYVTGTTQSPDFPTTVGAFRRTGSASNNQDIFVTKLNAAGTALVYSTFVGGSKADVGRRIAIDGSGNAYVAGQTTSSNFPTTNGAFDRTLAIPPNCPRCAGADNYDGVAFKLNASGSALNYSTYLGGIDIDSPRGIAVDGSGSAYIDGETLSADYPTTAGAFSRTHRGEYDVFVTKLNATGTALAYSTFLGGTAVDNGERVSVDAAGSAYVLGFSSSTDFPVTAGAADRTANGAFDVTISKLNPAGSALVYSTFLGGAGFDDGGGLAIDAAGNAYVSGGTGSTDFPTTPGAFDTTSDGGDAFVTKLNAAGSAFVYSTVVGGTNGEGAAGIAVDAAGSAWITGTTSSADFPVSANAADPSFNGVSDAFLTQLNPAGSAVTYSTLLGAAQGDNANDVARLPDGDPVITGVTYSMGFPATTGAFDTVWNGDASIFWGDAFVTRLDLDRTTSTPPAPPPIPAAPTLLAPSNGDTPPQPMTFDWSDVAGAATYQIQVDDSSAFTAPLLRDQTVSSSVYPTTDLPSSTLFWRARGINSLGQAGAWSAVRSFTPQAPPASAVLTNLDINPTSVAGGDTSSGTVILSVGAPFGGAVVALSSSNPAVASVPPSVTVPETGFTGGFAISTAAVQATTSVVITASYNGSTRTGTLTVTAGTPPPSTVLTNVAVSPGSVTGGSSAQGAVVLSAAAPSPVTVALASSDPAASVPPSVTVAAGSQSAVFAISTTAVAASTAVTISGTLAGTTRSATLTVTTAAPPPPPPSSATITLTASGRSGVTVTSSPAGLSVTTGSSGSASFATGTRVTLTVGSGRDAIFSGACSSGGQKVTSCAFTVGGSAAVSVNVQ
jgi:hypothetical protein